MLSFLFLLLIFIGPFISNRFFVFALLNVAMNLPDLSFNAFVSLKFLFPRSVRVQPINNLFALFSGEHLFLIVLLCGVCPRLFAGPHGSNHFVLGSLHNLRLKFWGVPTRGIQFIGGSLHRLLDIVLILSNRTPGKRVKFLELLLQL